VINSLSRWEGINMLDRISEALSYRENAEGVREFQPRATPWEPR